MKNPRSLVNVHNTYGKAHGMLLLLCRLCERVRSPVVTRVSVALINLENLPTQSLKMLIEIEFAYVYSYA